jgi:hypothetical protein
LSSFGSLATSSLPFVGEMEKQKFSCSQGISEHGIVGPGDPEWRNSKYKIALLSTGQAKI